MLHFTLICIAAFLSGLTDASARVPFSVFPNQRPQHSSIITEDLTLLKAKYPPFTVEQLSTHFSAPLPDGTNETFLQRYWIDTRFYKPGGPVVVLEGGEGNAEARLPSIDRGIIKYLAEATHGLGILLEHRYYGESNLTKDLSSPSLSLLTTAEALADTAYFAANFPYGNHDGLNASIRSDSTPWIHDGGSYGGGKSAFLRLLYPDQIWGSIASSAVVWANETFWQYNELARKYADPLCIQAIENVIDGLDKMILGTDKNEFGRWSAGDLGEIITMFGLEELTSTQDFMLTLTYPLSHWQSKNWDLKHYPAALDWDYFCRNLTLNVTSADDHHMRHERSHAEAQQVMLDSKLQTFNYTQALVNYAQYIRTYVVEKDCTSEGSLVTECFALKNQSWIYNTTLADNPTRLWNYQVCLEWGYWMTGAPEGSPTLASRTLDVDYYRSTCELAYGFDPLWHPNTTSINALGNFSLTTSRLLYIDGDQDPWLYATVHSPIADALGGNLDESEKGFLITESWHHCDENGLGAIDQEPQRIQQIHEKEISIVKGWIEDWKVDKGL